MNTLCGVSCRRSLLVTAVGAALGAVPGMVAAQTAGPPSGLDEIIVTSSLIGQPKRQIGTAVSSIDFEEIELRGYTDLSDVLRTQPGIAVSNAGGPGKTTALRIRGEESFRTMLMIDGIKAVDPSAPQVSPVFDSILSTSDLARVEVLRGPQGFIYGADAGGVVNVMTKTGADEVSGQVGLEYGEYALRKIDAAVSGGGEVGDYFVSVADVETDGFNAQAADNVLADKDGADNTTLHAKLGLNVSENVRLQLVARHIDADARYDGCFSNITFSTVHDCSVATDQTTYKLSADLNAGAFAHAFGYSNVDIARDNFSEGASAFATEGEIERLEYTGSFRPSDALTLVYGLDLQDETLISDPDRFNRGQEGYYVEYQGGFADNHFFLSIGARYDENDDFGSHTSSRVSGAYVQDLQSGQSLKYRASYGTGFRAPSLFEISYNAGPFAFPPAAGLPLSEELSAGYDIGVEYDAASGLHVEVTYFDQDIDDEIFFDLASFSGYLQSPGKSQSTGIEIATTVPFGERLQLNANYTHNEAENSTNEQRLRRPKQLANIGLAYHSADAKLGVIANYRLSRDAVDIGGIALDDYSVLDVSASYAMAERVEIYGRIQNATDEQYQEVQGYNTAGRSVYAGVRLRF